MKNDSVVSSNRKARHDYMIEQEYTAGIVLKGSEVRAMREGRAGIAEAYVGVEDGEIWLINSNVDVLSATLLGKTRPHEPRARRKLLLHKREIARIAAEIQRGGRTVVPLSLYFDPRGRVKLDIAVATRIKKGDIRAVAKEREWKRDKARILKGG